MRRSSTFQFLVLVVFLAIEISKVLSQVRVLLRLLSRPLTFLFQVEGPHPDLCSAASSTVSRDEAFQGLFRTFPRSQKSADVTGSSSGRVHAHSSSWIPAAYEAEEAVKRVQETLRRAEEALERARGLDQRKRKRKKKRKKRFPRSSALPRRVSGSRLRLLLQSTYAKVTGYHLASSSTPCTSGACGMQDFQAFATSLVATPVSVFGIAASWNDFGVWVFGCPVFLFIVSWHLACTAQRQFRIGLWVQIVHWELRALPFLGHVEEHVRCGGSRQCSRGGNWLLSRGHVGQHVRFCRRRLETPFFWEI